jgi:hypothetical protein
LADIQISEGLHARPVPKGVGMAIAATASLALWVGFFRLVGLA